MLPAPCPTLSQFLCCTRCSAGPCGSRLSGWGAPEDCIGTPWGTKCPLKGRSEPTYVSLGISWGLKFLMVSGGLHSHSLLEPVDRGGGEGQDICMRHEDIKGQLPWGHAGFVLEGIGASLFPWLRCMSCPLQVPSLFCPPGNCRSPRILLPSSTLRWTHSVAGIARCVCCPCVVLRLRVRVLSTWETLHLLGEGDTGGDLPSRWTESQLATQPCSF